MKNFKLGLFSYVMKNVGVKCDKDRTSGAPYTDAHNQAMTKQAELTERFEHANHVEKIRLLVNILNTSIMKIPKSYAYEVNGVKKEIALSSDTIKAIHSAKDSAWQTKILDKAIAAEEAKEKAKNMKDAIIQSVRGPEAPVVSKVVTKQDQEVAIVAEQTSLKRQDVVQNTQSNLAPLRTEVEYTSKNVAKERTKDLQDEIAFLSDVNNDGVSEAGKDNWYVGEAMLRETLLKLSPAKFKNFIIHLGLDNDDYASNPETFKKSFIEALGLRLATGIPLSAVVSGTEKKFLEKKTKLDREYVNSVLSEKEREELNKAVDSNAKVQEILKNLPGEADKKRFLDTLKFEGIGIAVGSAQGIGASINIKEATNNWLDNLQVGIINGIPGVGVSKNLYTSENKKVSVTGGLVNFIPFLTATGEVVRFDRTPEYFKNEIKGAPALSLFAGVTPGSLSLGVAIDAKKSKELDAKVRDMSGLLDRIMKAVITGSKVDTEGLSLSEDDKVALDKLTLQIEHLYIQTGSKPEYASILKDGYLRHYRDTLHATLTNTGISGTHFGGVGLGVTLLLGFFPIPMVGVSGERFSTSYTPSGKHERAESEATTEAIDKTQIDPVIKTLDGKYRTVFIPKNADFPIHSISAGKNVQIERREEGYYISGNNMPANIPLNLRTFKTNKGETNTLFIGETRYDGSGKIAIETGYAEKITQSITSASGEKTESNTPALTSIAGYSEVLEVAYVEWFIEGISRHINRHTLDSSSQAQKLQKSIFTSLQTGKIGSTWTEFIAFKKAHKGMKDIALPEVLSENGKRIILEAVYSNFAKDNYILDKAGVSPEESQKRQAALEKQLNNPAFVKWVKEWKIGLENIPAGVDVNLAIRYIFLTMNLATFDTNLGTKKTSTDDRQKAFDRVLSSFVGSKNPADIKGAQSARGEYMKSFEKQASFKSEFYTGGDLITFPVSAQYDFATGKRVHAGMTPITGAVEIAKNPSGKDFETIQSLAITKSLIEKMPSRVFRSIAQAFSAQGISSLNTAEAVKTAMLNDTKIPGITPATSYISFDTVFFKWGKCFNDAYGIKDLKLHIPCVKDGKLCVEDFSVTLNKSEVSVLNVQTNGKVDIGFGWTGKVEEKPKDQPPEVTTPPPTTKPPTTPPPTTKPPTTPPPTTKPPTTPPPTTPPPTIQPPPATVPTETPTQPTVTPPPALPSE